MAIGAGVSAVVLVAVRLLSPATMALVADRVLAALDRQA